VTAVDDDGMTLELIEEQPSGEVGFEGTVRVSRTGAARTARPLATTAGAWT
jgi:3-methylfumaryl-CoA hydratase